MLRDNGVAAERHWLVYLPVLAASVALMLPALLASGSAGSRQAGVRRRGGRAVRGTAALRPGAAARCRCTIAALVVFFAGFNLLEAMLPSLVSKFAPPAIKGTAIGVYSSVQFLGAFAGAAAGGWLSQ